MAANIQPEADFRPPVQATTLNSFFLRPVSEPEVVSIILKMNPKKAVGIDGITVPVLQCIAGYIAGPSARIINQAMTSGTCPTHFKLAEVVPLHKAGDRHDASSYRPISLISNLAKIFEKALKNRIVGFIEQERLLSSMQFGFRAGVSTNDALAHVTDYIYDKLDQSIPTIAIFLDLAKAFDTVNHEILLRKLENCGIRGVANILLRDYPTDRKQVVILNDTRSKGESVRMGVPQGTILGPILFIIYINNLLSSFREGEIISFADDTVIFCAGKSWEVVRDQAQLRLATVWRWLNLNQLSLNLGKTVFITFSNYKDKLPTNCRIKVHGHNCCGSQSCGCVEIGRVERTKYLGLIVDCHLRWDHHVMYIVKRIRYLLFVFFKLRSTL